MPGMGKAAGRCIFLTFARHNVDKKTRSLSLIIIRLVAVGGFEREKLPFFRLARQILQSKSGIFDEKFNDERRKKGFFAAKGSHRNK